MPSGRRDHPEALETEVSAPVEEVGRSRQAGVVPPRSDLLVGDWTARLACCFRFLGRLTSCALSAWAERLRGSRSARDPGFMNPTLCVISINNRAEAYKLLGDITQLQKLSLQG